MLANRLLSSSFMSAVDLGVRTLISFWVTVIVARNFGVEAYATLSLAMSLQVITTTIVRYGLEQVYLRDMCTKKYGSNVHLYYSILLINSGLIITIITIAYLCAFSENKYLIFLIFILRSTFFSDIIFKGKFYSEDKILLYHVFNIMVNLLYLLIIFVVYKYQSNFFILCVFLCADALIYYSIFKMTKTTSQLRVSFDCQKTYVEYSSLFINSIAVVLYMNLDRWMILYYASEEDVAFYGAAYKINAVIFQLIPVILGVLAPTIYRMNNEGSNSQDFSKKIGPTVFILSMLVTLMMYFTSPSVLIWVFGPQFEPSEKLVVNMAIMIPLVFWGAFQSVFFVSLNSLTLLMKRNTLILTCNILLNFAFIPQMGALGAIYATILSGIIGYGYTFITDEQAYRIFCQYINVRQLIRV